VAVQEGERICSADDREEGNIDLEAARPEGRKLRLNLQDRYRRANCQSSDVLSEDVWAVVESSICSSCEMIVTALVALVASGRDAQDPTLVWSHPLQQQDLVYKLAGGPPVHKEYRGD
jgi:hypothetical protein